MKLIGYLTASHTPGKENTEIFFFFALFCFWWSEARQRKMSRSPAGGSTTCTAAEVSLKSMTKRGQLEERDRNRDQR